MQKKKKKTRLDEEAEQLGYENQAQRVSFKFATKQFHEQLSNIYELVDKLTKGGQGVLLPSLCVAEWKWGEFEGKWDTSMFKKNIKELKKRFDEAVANKPHPPKSGLIQNVKFAFKKLTSKTTQNEGLPPIQKQIAIFQKIQGYTNFDFSKEFEKVEFADDAKWFVYMLKTVSEEAQQDESVYDDQFWGYWAEGAKNSSIMLIQGLHSILKTEAKEYAGWVHKQDKQRTTARILKEEKKIENIIEEQKKKEDADDKTLLHGRTAETWGKCVDITESLIQAAEGDPVDLTKLTEKLQTIKFQKPKLGEIKIDVTTKNGKQQKTKQNISKILSDMVEKINELKDNTKKHYDRRLTNQSKYETFVDTCKEDIINGFNLDPSEDFEKTCEALKNKGYPGDKNSTEPNPWTLTRNLLTLQANQVVTKKDISVDQKQTKTKKQTNKKTFFKKTNKSKKTLDLLCNKYERLTAEIDKVNNTLNESFANARQWYDKLNASLLAQKNDILGKLKKYKEQCEFLKAEYERACSRFRAKRGGI